MKNIKIISLILIMVAVSISCDTEKLEPAPSILFSDLVVFKTPSRIAQQLNGLYSGNSIKNGNFLGGRYFIHSDIRGEEFMNVRGNASTGLNIWNFTMVESSGPPATMWRYAYASINLVNTFLAGLEANKDNFVAPDFPADYSTTVNQYIGEARFVRAVAYHYLLQSFAKSYMATGDGSSLGLPLRLTAESSSENNDMVRSTVAQVYDQILDDLDFAEANVPLTYGEDLLNASRAHRNAVIAFKTKVYLAKGDWGNVITEANKIVSATAPFEASTGVPHKLEPSISSVFAAPQLTSENIFSMIFTNQDNPGTQNQLGFYWQAAGGAEYYLNPTGIISDPNWLPTDERRDLIVTSGGNEWLNKFATPTPYTDKVQIIRYSEVLLNLAEARVRSTNTVDTQALALLNAVRGRADATTQWVAGDFADADALTAAILHERQIEFLGEGMRSLDVMRLNMPFAAKGSVPSVDPTDPTYLWPIPDTELRANSLMVRN
ncbi:MAG TPA: RagB/SusD family nutrient uptake outer membrane protein [Cyclobacteriaceae bacterium]|nr:RagB/SusD family nutrient uptake outer membrane protein [Cyclobacteriaceae bacterium]